MTEQQLEFQSEDRAIRAVNGLCRYCSSPRPPGYSVTCGDSHCQESAYHDAPRRTVTRRKSH